MLQEFKITVYSDNGITADTIRKNVGVLPTSNDGNICIVDVEEAEEIINDEIEKDIIEPVKSLDITEQDKK